MLLPYRKKCEFILVNIMIQTISNDLFLLYQEVIVWLIIL